MKSQDYIIKRLEEITRNIANISVRYAYENSTDYNIIEVSPESIRRGSEKYMEWEYSVLKDFTELFPNEDIVISEVNENNDMSNLLYPDRWQYISNNYPDERTDYYREYNSAFSAGNNNVEYALAA